MEDQHTVPHGIKMWMEHRVRSLRHGDLLGVWGSTHTYSLIAGLLKIQLIPLFLITSQYICLKATAWEFLRPSMYQSSWIRHPLTRTQGHIAEHHDDCPIYLILLIWFNLVEPKEEKSTWRQTSKELTSLSNYKACCLIVQILVGLARVSANLLF